jgi:hypothetical protein
MSSAGYNTWALQCLSLTMVQLLTTKQQPHGVRILPQLHRSMNYEVWHSHFMRNITQRVAFAPHVLYEDVV